MSRNRDRRQSRNQEEIMTREGRKLSQDNTTNNTKRTKAYQRDMILLTDIETNQYQTIVKTNEETKENPSCFISLTILSIERISNQHQGKRDREAIEITSYQPSNYTQLATPAFKAASDHLFRESIWKHDQLQTLEKLDDDFISRVINLSLIFLWGLSWHLNHSNRCFDHPCWWCYCLLLVQLISTQLLPQRLELFIFLLLGAPINSFILLLSLLHDRSPILIIQFLLNLSHEFIRVVKNINNLCKMMVTFASICCISISLRVRLMTWSRVSVFEMKVSISFLVLNNGNSYFLFLLRS